MEAVPRREQLAAASLRVTVGQRIQQSGLANQLAELGFERVDFVYEPGQYAVRGGIMDVYSYSNDDPYRLDFFGDEVDSIRTFDIENQLSKEKVAEATIVQGGSEVVQGGSEVVQSGSWLMDYMPEGRCG